MDYYLLNIIIDEKSQVDHWIEEKKFAPIFYEDSTINQILTHTSSLKPKQKPIAYLFCKTFLEINENAIIISIGKNYIYFYKQIGKLQEMEMYERVYKQKEKKSRPKGFCIEIIKKVLIKNCPLVLASIKSNRQMQAAFRKINYLGNILSIKYILTEEKQVVESFKDYLLCLSSLEFETLIAKIFEEQGFFVPAYKGGFLENFDLVCEKDGQKKTIQIKLQMEEEHYKDSVCIDYYYCIINNYIPIDNIKNWIIIYEELKNCSNTKKWLNKSLYWVTYKED